MPSITNIAFTLSLTFSFTILIGQSNVDHKTTDLIKKLDADIQNAVASGDTSFLEKHLANDLIFTHSDGRKDGKEDWIKFANEGLWESRTANVLETELHNKIAVVYGILDIKTKFSEADGKSRCYNLSYYHLFRYTNDTWKLFSHRTIEVINPPSPCLED